MTWVDFKKGIEDQGVEDNDEILWIDWQSWEPVVKRNMSGEVYIE